MDGQIETPDLSFRWTQALTERFIRLRVERDNLFTGVKNSALSGWRGILLELGLQGRVTPPQCKKKWDNLKRKYKECRDPLGGCGASGRATAATWPWYGIMEELLGHLPSMAPAAHVVVSLTDDEPGPSGPQDYDEGEEGEEVEEQQEEEEEVVEGEGGKRMSLKRELQQEDEEGGALGPGPGPSPGPPPRRRMRQDQTDALVELIREDMEETRRHMNRLLDLLAQLVERR